MAKKTAPVNTPSEIVIEMGGLTFGDLEVLESLSEGAENGNFKAGEMGGFLDRVVQGGVRDLPLSQMSEVVEALTAAMAGLMQTDTESEGEEKN